MSNVDTNLALGLCSCPCHLDKKVMEDPKEACPTCVEIVCKHRRLLAYLNSEDPAEMPRKIRFLCFRPGKDTLFGEFENSDQAVETFTSYLEPGETAYIVFDTGKFVTGGSPSSCNSDEVSTRGSVGPQEGAGV